MKKYLITLALGCLVIPISLKAKNSNTKPGPVKDTLELKCKLFSAALYYGMELGEKPTPTMVDTLVNEIPEYDTSAELDLVVVSAKDLGFTGQTNILWQQILDSAESRGYQVCPPQAGPEVYVLSQNIPSRRNLFSNRVFDGRPVFVGMDRIRHQLPDSKKGHLFKRKNYFDYVFCIKSNAVKHCYELGYSATNTVTDSQNFIWNYKDRFIFINRPNPGKNRVSICKN